MGRIAPLSFVGATLVAPKGGPIAAAILHARRAYEGPPLFQGAARYLGGGPPFREAPGQGSKADLVRGVGLNSSLLRGGNILVQLGPARCAHPIGATSWPR